MKFKRVSLFVAATSVSLGLAGSLAQAQEAPQKAAQALEGVLTTSYKVIPIRNVSPALIAFWLDPKRHPVPPQLANSGFKSSDPMSSRTMSSELLAKKVGNQEVFQLPSGVTLINPIELQNSLLVLGTPEGIKNIEETVRFLDRPLRQVEIECNFAVIKDENLADLGIVLPEGKNEQMNLTFVRGNFQQKLNAAVRDQKARLITAPRVTVINNLSASILSTRDESNTGDGLKFTPTINNDHTITLMMELGQSQLKTATANNTGKKEIAIAGSRNFVANVRDGDTIALMEVSPNLLPNFKGKSLAPGENLVLFTTPRIIRRAAEIVELKTANLTK